MLLQDDIDLKVQLLSENAQAPQRANPTDAGLDLFSAENAVLYHNDIILLKTDIAVAIPEGYYGRVAPRSGLAVKHGIDVLAGVVDSAYRGNLGVVLVYHGKGSIQIKKGDRIAQLILEKIALPKVVLVDSLDSTDRGDGGFGSTGK